MFLHDQADNAIARLLLAHGAGAPMDHPWLEDLTNLLVARRISVSRFEFAFMAARREEGKRRPAPRGDKLIPEYEAMVHALRVEFDDSLPLFIGGKSLGGRVASLVATNLYSAKAIRGLICYSYPFHPAGKPGTLRTAHLATFDCPALILQGTRDPLGNRSEVESYDLDRGIHLHWLEDGDHDLKPRKKSGYTLAEHLQSAADATTSFVHGHKPGL